MLAPNINSSLPFVIDDDDNNEDASQYQLYLIELFSSRSILCNYNRRTNKLELRHLNIQMHLTTTKTSTCFMCNVHASMTGFHLTPTLSCSQIVLCVQKLLMQLNSLASNRL